MRLVVPAPPETETAVGADTSSSAVSTLRTVDKGDNYGDRLVKYVPIESVAVYLGLNLLLLNAYPLTPEGVRDLDPRFFWLAWIMWGVILLGTPVYLRKQRKGNQPWVLNAVIGTAAFIAWSYSIGGGIWVGAGLFDALVAACIAPLFTFVAPAFSP